MIKHLLATVFLAVGVLSAAAMESWQFRDVVYGDNVLLENGCSGTVIDKQKKIILTASHCVAGYLVWDTDGKIKERKQFTVEFRTLGLDGEVKSELKTVGRVEKYDEDTDLATIWLDDPYFIPATEAKLATTNVIQLGEEVYCVGNPLGRDHFGTVSHGIVTALNRDYSKFGRGLWKYPLFGNDCTAVGGNSGGAVYNTYGELIGVTVAVMRGENGERVTGLTSSVRIKEIREFLNAKN